MQAEDTEHLAQGLSMNSMALRVSKNGSSVVVKGKGYGKTITDQDTLNFYYPLDHT